MSNYQSSMLRCNVEEDGCAICEFLNGRRDPAIVMEVIRQLDAALARSEGSQATMMEFINSKILAKASE